MLTLTYTPLCKKTVLLFMYATVYVSFRLLILNAVCLGVRYRIFCISNKSSMCSNCVRWYNFGTMIWFNSIDFINPLSVSLFCLLTLSILACRCVYFQPLQPDQKAKMWIRFRPIYILDYKHSVSLHFEQIQIY